MLWKSFVKLCPLRKVLVKCCDKVSERPSLEEDGRKKGCAL